MNEASRFGDRSYRRTESLWETDDFKLTLWHVYGKFNIDDIVGFHGGTDAELRDAFENMIELYIETLAEPENPTQKQCTDSFLTRLRQAFRHKFMKQ